jgi:Metallo-peptidase family M12
MAHKRKTIGLAVAAAIASISPFAAFAVDVTIVEPAYLPDAPPAVQSNFAKVNNTRQFYTKESRLKLVKMLPSARNLLTTVNAADVVLVWKLFEDVQLKSVRVSPVSPREATTINWVGTLTELDKKPLATTPEEIVVSTFERNHVYARFVSNGRVFQLVPLGDGYHASIEVDFTRVPEYRDQMDPGGMDGGGDQPDGSDDTPGAPIPPAEPEIPPLSGCSFGPPRRTTVDIGIAYTEEAVRDLPAIGIDGRAIPGTAGLGDMGHFSAYLIHLTQQSFDYSKVNITARLADYQMFTGLETAYQNAKVLFRAIRTEPTSPIGGIVIPAPTPIPAWRARKNADLAVLITTRDLFPIGASWVKVGGLSPARDQVLKKENGYSLVLLSTADAQLSFAHELGHHFGAAHDPQWARYPRFSYGMGYRHFCTWRSIMAYADTYQCPTGVPRLGVWSSCGLRVGRMPAGSLSQNNVRLLNQKSEIVEAYFP